MSEDGKIKEVYKENFEQEIRIIGSLIDRYNFVSMDTEFPGFYFQQGQTQNYPIKTESPNYIKLKSNVDLLKLIQVGISLADADGNSPPGTSTWQFNFNFDLNTDQSTVEAISLLTSSGINFDKISKLGISMESFGEYLMTSGLVLNDDITWISFHGSYDFAYLLKVITGGPLPDTENKYMDLLKLYFPNYYDIRYLIRHYDYLRGSLSKLAIDFDVKRFGTQHQAGSDSLVTGEVFFKLKKHFFNESNLKQDINNLFSYDEFYDPATQYTTNIKSTQSTQINQGPYFDVNNYYMNYNYVNKGYPPNMVNVGSSSVPPYQYINSMGNMNSMGNLNNMGNLGALNSMNNGNVNYSNIRPWEQS